MPLSLRVLPHTQTEYTSSLLKLENRLCLLISAAYRYERENCVWGSRKVVSLQRVLDRR